MVEQARKTVEMVMNRQRSEGINNASLVVEIGSNDGYLLKWYRHYGIPVLGIDPSIRASGVAARNGVPTIPEVFTAKLGKEMGRVADVVHVNNVLAHAEDQNDMVAGISSILKPKGIAIFEVADFDAMVEKGSFDQIYHEHACYFTLKSLKSLLWKHHLRMVESTRIPSHGGSIRVIADFSGIPITIEPKETKYREFEKKVRTIRSQNIYELAKLKSIAGFGAAAKATIMLNYFGLTDETISCVADETPGKIGKWIPGTGIQVVSVEDWIASKPDYTVLFAWNYAEEIMKRFSNSYKGKWILPLPEFKII